MSIPERFLCMYCGLDFGSYAIGRDRSGVMLWLCGNCRDTLAREDFIARQTKARDALVRAELSDGALTVTQ